MRGMPARLRARSGRLLVSGAVVATFLTGVMPGQASGQDGEAIFQGTCKACHTIGGGRVVGPDLAGVSERQSEAWLIAFVQHSQAVIASGDSDAVALAAQYPGLSMPDWPLSDGEVRAVLAYIQQVESAGPVPTAAGAAAPEDGDPVLGRKLFQGTTRFVNGGPTCNSCHDVSHEDVIGGGVLAKDLTTVFSRLGGPGVRAIVGSPPFPVMQRAFQNRPLTDEEVGALVAFLQQADATQSLHQPLDYGKRLLAAGLSGAALLLGLYSLVWRKRRRGPVNRAIYARQVRST
ncbi:MAG: c-type cytochrome [Gemmatimonadaceae bacterium]